MQPLGGILTLYSMMLSLYPQFETLHPQVSLDSTVVAYWSFDNEEGSLVIDFSSFRNHGEAVGTSIVPGIVGFGRRFDGMNDFIKVQNPRNQALSFDSSESFTIEAWFNSKGTGGHTIVRKGLAPVPGYLLRLFHGRVQGQIGNRGDGNPPDTLLTVTSTNTYNDGRWHHVVFVRDRERRKLFLYVDGVLAASPVDDHFPYALRSNAPLEIGRWGVYPGYEYFKGVLDEIRITKGTPPPLVHKESLVYAPKEIDFGQVRIRKSVTANIRIKNMATEDTVAVVGILIPPAIAFSITQPTIAIPPFATKSIQVKFEPIRLGTFKSQLLLYVANRKTVLGDVSLSGISSGELQAPIICAIEDVPDDHGRQVRLVWARSSQDIPKAKQRIHHYAVWRRFSSLNSNGNPTRGDESETWEYIASIPAANLKQYSMIAPTLLDSVSGTERFWSVFKVSAHRIDGRVYWSAIDSGYSIANVSAK